MTKHTSNIKNEAFDWLFLFRSYRAQVVLFCCVAIYGMLWSAEALISISMAAMVVIAVFQVDYPSSEQARIKLFLRKEFKENIKLFWSNKVWVWVSIPFLLVLFSSIYSSDLHYTLERLRIKLPFALLPFAFFSIPKFEKKDAFIILYFFVLAALLAALSVLTNYYQNFEEINNMISKGQPIPTPSNHIRFSLAIAMSIFSGVALVWNDFYLKFKVEKWLLAILSIFLFIFLHILSVRSGLIAFYCAFIVFVIQYIYNSKRYFIGLGLVLLLFSIPYFAMQLVPSFKQKVAYMEHDIIQFQKGNGEGYSDSERLISLTTGLEIFKKNPLLGVGAGDLKKEVFEFYKNEIKNSASPRMPHNQFISIAAGTGIIGLLLFIFSFFYPLLYKKNYKNYLFTALYVIFFISFFMENTFENNYGLSLFLFFLLVGLRVLKVPKSSTFS